MSTVISDQTGQVVPVKPVEAVLAIAIVSQLSNELPSDAAQRIEQAMSIAASQAMADGISDPDKIRERMLSARDSIRIAMYSEMRDARSQAAAGE